MSECMTYAIQLRWCDSSCQQRQRLAETDICSALYCHSLETGNCWQPLGHGDLAQQLQCLHLHESGLVVCNAESVLCKRRFHFWMLQFGHRPFLEPTACWLSLTEAMTIPHFPAVPLTTCHSRLHPSAMDMMARARKFGSLDAHLIKCPQ